MSKALFEYSLRVSPRGRNVRLRVTLKHGLEVIVPKGYDKEKVPGILERKKHWIRSAVEQAAENRKFFEPEPTWRLPYQIKLSAIGSIWYIEAKESDMAGVIIRKLDETRLLAFGRIHDEQACRAALVRWLMRQTREHLVPRLQEISLKTGLRYDRIYVRRQRTRWGSCSRHRAISLNAKLLFLPSDLVDYVMVHELCHVAEMKHSKRFWERVERHCHDFRKLDSRLRELWKSVPRWAV